MIIGHYYLGRYCHLKGSLSNWAHHPYAKSSQSIQSDCPSSISRIATGQCSPDSDQSYTSGNSSSWCTIDPDKQYGRRVGR